jgi:hypothetical protein
MNEFNKRWQMLAQKAGSLADEALPELAFGFATRVIAGGRETVVESWDEMLSALGLRALLVTACMCLITGGLAYSEWYPVGIERPALEQTLTNELPWP